MPDFGDVFRFKTDKVIGEEKYKYHIAVFVGGNTGQFLFINSLSYANEESMRIDKCDWPNMTNEYSHICFSYPIYYERSELARAKIYGNLERAGRITDDCIRRLRSNVENSLTLTNAQIKFILKQIDDYLEN